MNRAKVGSQKDNLALVLGLQVKYFAYMQAFQLISVALFFYIRRHMFPSLHLCI